MYPALTVSGIGSIGINTSIPTTMLQIMEEDIIKGIIGINTTALYGASYNVNNVNHTGTSEIIARDGVTATAIAAGIATFKASGQHTLGPAVVLVDVDTYNGEYKGGAGSGLVGGGKSLLMIQHQLESLLSFL